LSDYRRGILSEAKGVICDDTLGFSADIDDSVFNSECLKDYQALAFFTRIAIPAPPLRTDSASIVGIVPPI
jgi:hypothetical protein